MYLWRPEWQIIWKNVCFLYAKKEFPVIPDRIYLTHLHLRNPFPNHRQSYYCSLGFLAPFLLPLFLLFRFLRQAFSSYLAKNIHLISQTFKVRVAEVCVGIGTSAQVYWKTTLVLFLPRMIARADWKVVEKSLYI